MSPFAYLLFCEQSSAYGGISREQTAIAGYPPKIPTFPLVKKIPLTQRIHVYGVINLCIQLICMVDVRTYTILEPYARAGKVGKGSGVNPFWDSQ